MKIGDTFQTKYNVSTEDNIGDPVMIRYWRVTEVLPTRRNKRGDLIFEPHLTSDKFPIHIHIDADEGWAVRATPTHGTQSSMTTPFHTALIIAVLVYVTLVIIKLAA